MCAANQILKMNGTGTALECAADADTNSGGDITDITAGSGLTGGGTTGAVTLNVSGVTSGMIADGTIANIDLAVDSVAGTNIVGLSVDTAHIAPDAVTAGKIMDGAVLHTKIAACATTDHILKWNGSVWACGPDTASNVTSAMITDFTIAAGDLATGAVTSDKIFDGTIGTADLANNSVTSSKIGGLLAPAQIAFTPGDINFNNPAYINLTSTTIGVGTGSPGGKFHIVPSNASQTPLILEGFAGQSTNMLEIKNSGGTPLVTIEPSGAINSKYQGARCTKATASIGGSGSPVLTSSTGITCPMISNGIVDATSGAVMLKKKGYYRISGKLKWDLATTAPSYRELLLYTATDVSGSATMQEQNFFRFISSAVQDANTGTFEYQQMQAVIYVDADNSRYLHMKASQMSGAALNVTNIEYNIEFLGN
jgi:hypothetical protein